MRSLLRKTYLTLCAAGRYLAIWLVSVLAIVVGPAGRRFQRPLLNLIGINTRGTVFFGRWIIVHSPSRLHLGDRVAIGDNAHIACHAPIRIGDDFLAAPGLYLNSGGHATETLEGYGKPITIGARVWCGVRVTICAGVDIGDDVVIAAGAVVVNSIPSGCVAAGVPAKPIKALVRDPARFVSWTSG